MFRNNLLQAIKHTSIYSLSWIANAIAGVCLLPIYSRYLSRAEYGALDLVGQNNTILALVFAACFTYSVGRLYHDADTEDKKKKVIASGASSAIASGILAGTTLLLLSAKVSEMLLGSVEYAPLIIAGAIVLTLEVVFTGLTYEYLVTKKSTKYVIINVAKLPIAAVGNLTCLIWFDLGAISMLIGNTLGLVFANACMVVPHYRKVGLSIDIQILKKMIVFGSPMIIAGILATLLHSSDRIMLRPIKDLEQVGLFMMGLQFPSMLNAILMTSFATVWSGSLMFTMSKQPDADVQIGRLATYLLAFFISAQTVLGIFGASLIEVLTAPKFATSIPIIPVACLGYTFHALHLFFVSKAFTHSNPRLMVICYAIPLLAKFGLTLWLVPIYGFMGSVWILTTGYLLFTFTCFQVFRSKITATFEWTRMLMLYGLAALFLLLASHTNTNSIFVQIALQLTLTFAYVLCLAFGPIFTAREKKIAIQEILSRYKTIRTAVGGN